MDKICGSQSPKKLPPLLVNIQSTNTQTLDFNGVKSRNVTCVEATNLFLFMGCASGTTYVFARESLKFLFVIGFKGGKVCRISCAPDESDVAIGSVRGKVSIYRLSPNLHVALSVASSPGECFRHLYALPHHIDQEVTEMTWSPNGKYLFVGDSQGIVSQVDVGCLEEFPRPPPSQVILKVSDRVLQMDCTFPYLAVCCTSAVFLCDLEKEDFTRVKRGNKDIKATGICFKLAETSASSKEEDCTFLSRLSLLIGEFGTGRIHRSNMQGKIIATQKVKINTFQKGAAKIFDPKNSSPIPDTNCSTDGNDEVTFSFGKLYSGENHYLVTLLNDRLFIIDGNSLEMVFWSEDFQRIHSLTMISNYMFIWNGNKLDIISFTEFRPYSMQLLSAGLHSVLEQWVFHTLHSVGWRKIEEDELSPDADTATKQFSVDNNLSIELFETLLCEVACQDPLCSFLVSFLPFELPNLKTSNNSDNSLEETDPFAVAVEKFVQSLRDIFKLNEDADFPKNSSSFNDAAKTIKLFYEEIGAEIPSGEIKNNISFAKIISKTHTFLKQPQLVNLPELFEEHSVRTSKTVFKMTKEFLGHFFNFKFSKIDHSIDSSMCFMDYNKNICESGWFSRIGICDDSSFWDSIFADALILVIPLLTQDCILEIITSIGVMNNIENLFCTWIVVANFLNATQIVPYAPLLRMLQSESFRVHPKDVFSHIYQDLLVKDISRPAKYLHHFVSALIFTGENEENNKRIVLMTLLSAFPFKNWPKKETIEKIEILCTKNPILLKIYQMACLEDRNFPSLQLCDCRLPILCTNPKSPLYSQKIIEEGILKVLAKTQVKISTKDSFTQNDIHDFAMKRLLLEPYFKLSFGKQLPEFVKTNLILRTGSLSLLSLVPTQDPKFLQALMKEVKNFRIAAVTGKLECKQCKQLLELEKDFQPLTEESFALWYFNTTGSIHNLIELVGNVGLNEQSTFSLRFYQQLIKTIGKNFYF